MEEFKKTITTFDEIIFENSSGKTIVLSEFRVPRKCRAIDYNLFFRVTDGFTPGAIAIETLFPKSEKHINDLSATPPISVPPLNLLTIRVERPKARVTTKMRMFLLYQQ
jgi:hypothetical protein